MFYLKGNKKVYVITNRHLIKQGNLYEVIDKCGAKGADGVILREKDLQYKDLKQIAKKIKYITDKYKIPLIINGNLDAAVDINANGFHTGLESFRKLVLEEKLLEKVKLINDNYEFRLGVSIHSVEEAVEAEKLGANYILAGHVFETDCKKGLKGRGIRFIEDICSTVNIPVIAIGGINQFNILKVIDTKVLGVAIMSSAMEMK